MGRRAQDAPAAEVADNVEQSFQGEALAPAPRRRGRGSSGKEVMSLCVFGLNVNKKNGFVGLIFCYSDC